MNISKTVNDHKCILCGGCYSICPTNAIHMIYQEKIGFYKPQVSIEKCINCSKCKQYCPAEIKPLENSPLGNFEQIHLAHSTDAFIRYNTTSGGVINSLVRYLINKNIVDGVLMTTYDAASPIEASPQLISAENVFLLQKNPRNYTSRYVIVPLLTSLKSLEKKRLAIVGTPCQIKALTLWENLAHLEFFKIGITCSGGMSYKATEQYKLMKKMINSKMYYRGNGWPGKNSLISEEQVLEYAHLGSLFERMFSSQIFKNPGCRFCTDHFAEEADISFCDFWNEQERQVESEGNSCVIIRTQKALDIYNSMLEDKYIQLVRELTPTETINTQLTVLKAKKGNLRNTLKYHFFIKLIDIIFKYHLYDKFNLMLNSLELYGQFGRTDRQFT